MATLVVSPNIYLGHGRKAVATEGFICFEAPEIHYFGYCDDFGPMNAAAILDFIDIVDRNIQSNPGVNLIFCAGNGKRNFTNAAFLLGSYAILSRNETPEELWKRLGALPAETFEFYRDATFTESKFDLTLLDCWRGLARAKTLGWIDSPQNDGNVPFGSLDKDEYKHYDNPLNGDLHFVVPGKFIAFRGPVDLPGGEEYLDQDGFREFSAHYYVELFQVLGVSTVVRLNERRYDGGVFEAAGIRHVDLPFEDCTAPPDAVVARFLRAADAASGLVAVHCKGGLGRTGTLIALYMMRRHGFTARAAMGWLRVMRPGSVIGEQQHYLCAVERDVAAAAAAAAARQPRRAASFTAALLQEPSVPVAAGRSAGRRMVRMASADSEVLARQVAEAARRRAATIIQTQI